MQLLLEREHKLEEGRRIIFLLSPRSVVGKSTLFVNLLREFGKVDSSFGIDLDIYNPRNVKNYFKRCMTLRDFEGMGYKPWRVSSRVIVCKKIISEIHRLKGVIIFNLTPGIQEDNIFLLKNLQGIKIMVVRGGKNVGVLSRRFLKQCNMEGIKIDGIVECMTKNKRYFENFAKRNGIPYLGSIRSSKKIRVLYEGDENVYKDFLETFYRMRELL